MGEYAKRISDGAVVKLGTCESMYYARFSDRDKVAWLHGNIDVTKDEDCAGLKWRLPFPDEDGIEVGNYQDFDRDAILSIPYGDGGSQVDRGRRHFPVELLNLEPGTIQLSHPCGYLVNAICYHGAKLPTGSADLRVGWNGRDPYSVRLLFVKSILENFEESGQLKKQLVLYPVIGCRHCRKMWSCRWDEIWDAIPEALQKRFSEDFKLELNRAISPVCQRVH